jgi:hypothetical protein
VPVSVLVTFRVPVDVEKFRSLLDAEPDRFRSIAEQGRAAGGIHHRFGIGEGYVLVNDEWESVEAFQRFFSNPEIAAVMVEGGALGEPEITFAELIDSPDQF